MSVGLIGKGVVGTAVYNALQAKKITTSVFDLDLYKCERVENLSKTEFCFVCVPTPTQSNGDQNLKALNSALGKLVSLKYKGIVILKSTVVPGTCNYLKEKFSDLQIVFNPEFLTERNACKDFIEQSTVVLSGSTDDCMLCAGLYNKILPQAKCVTMSYTQAELVKYMHNCTLAIQLSFFNELFFYSGLSSQDFQTSIEVASEFGNVKKITVPGPDGKHGWSGMCFVKDTLALLKKMQNTNNIHETLSGAIKTNKAIRPEAYNGTENTGIKYK